MSEQYNKKKILVVPSEQVYAAGGRCMTFDSIKELAAFFNVSYQYVAKKLAQFTESNEELPPWRGFYLEYLF